MLDNFCGSGAMLFERAFYPHASLTGVDIAQAAVQAAQENEEYRKSGAKFYHADALRFTAKKFDEVICNMPFGLRVGTAPRTMLKLYESYIAVLPSILETGGRAFLYTHEKAAAGRPPQAPQTSKWQAGQHSLQAGFIRYSIYCNSE